MDAIEKAIRNAFEKGNAEDRAFREKVYRSAFAALDRALQANPGVTVENAINRRKAMQAKIAEIESEFLPAVPNVEPAFVETPEGPGEAPAIPVVGAPVQAVRREPAIEPAGPSAADASDVVPEPDLAGSRPRQVRSRSDGVAAEIAPDHDERRIRGRRRPLMRAIFSVILLALIVAGLWWLVQTGMFRTLAGRDTPPSAPATVEDNGSQGAGGLQTPGETEQARNWITVFTPSDPTLVNAPSDAKADVMQDDTGSFLRVRSGRSGSSVAIDVGQGILEQLAGRHAVFMVIARAEEGQETQMSIDCNFGDLGDCGRKRYLIGHERNEYLFDVRFPDQRPGAAGTIAINSDFDNKGKSVDIYEIRVSVAE